ncbi:MAG: phospho-sugar mutase [Thermoleophilia bacterium]|nr:phospho-sugar mutase [Thermoleophilia bacterium]
MPALDAALAAEVERWIARDPDHETRAELDALVAQGAGAELRGRFSGRLRFGTAGLRGEMAAGPARMNRLVVLESAAGIARYLLSHVLGARDCGVVVAHDARHRSAQFATDVARVLSGHGIRVVRAARPIPTPAAVYAIRNQGCVAGIVITASHNPPADNGLKLYLGDGAQIIPPVDGEVADAITAVASDGELLPRPARAAEVGPLPPEAIDAYVSATLGRAPRVSGSIGISTTAMHGVGGELLERILGEAGFDRVSPVEAQRVPHPEFPTVSFPNPEEPGATDLLAQTMIETGSKIGLALDPDADRLAVLVARDERPPHRLTGDDVGALLGDWLLAEVTQGPDRLVVSSVVSSTLLPKVAEHHGARHVETLTGFKWLCRPAMENPSLTQVLAYEEALGYAVGPEVRDKDGISAALVAATMAAALHQEGRSLLDALDALHLRHGAHVTENFSVPDDAPGGAERCDTIVSRLVDDPPSELAGHELRRADLPAADVLRLDLGDSLRVAVRSSGTEPKLKCYCEAIEPVEGGVVAARQRARERLSRVREALSKLIVS